MRRINNSFLYLTAGAAFIALLLQGCKGCNGGRETPSTQDTVQVARPTAKDSLKSWAELRLIQWKGWVDSSTAGAFGTDSLERILVDTVAALDTSTMEEDRFREFQPYFVYSPDSSHIVDMVSYGNFLHKGRNGKTVLEAGEPDVEVAIVDAQTKKRERILFAGPSTVIKEAVWVDDHTVLIGGGTYDEQNKLQPVIWKYNTQSKLLENWEAQ